MTVLTPTEGQSGAWADLEPGVYEATLTAIEDVGVSAAYPDSGPRFRLVYTLDGVMDEEGKPVTMFSWCSQKLTTGAKQSNLWALAETLGAPPQKGVPYDVEAQLAGKRCQVVVNLKDTQNGPRPGIANVLPPRKGPAGAMAAAAPPAAPAADDVCGVPGCGKPLARYDDKGIPLCEGHSA